VLAGRFRVVRRIARGGMGVVYEAFDEKLQRRIALKCARDGQGRYLTPEVRLATEVSHPNLCKIYEIHTSTVAGQPLEFFTMEFLEGPTLFERLRNGPLPRQETEIIARQLCAGLAEAHRNHIIHGDLKSGNIIVAKNPNGSLRAVITDFGLARSALHPGVTGGSPGYMAPELFAGAPTTVASDIYALGVLLYELVCGFRPHEHAAMAASTVTQGPMDPATKTDRSESLAAAAKTPFTPLRSRWDPILRTCLQPDPKNRYRSADQVLQALGPSVTRRRVALLSGALAFAALAAFFTYRQSTAPAETVRLDVAVQTPQLQQADREIAKLPNSAKIAFSVHKSRATHQLTATVEPKGSKLTLRAVLRDLRSGAPVTEWSADYDPAQLRYAPIALAGVVSSAFHLPPLTTYATVQPEAAVSYQQGIALLPDDQKIDAALAAFQSASQADPDSALPFAGLAEAQRRKAVLTRQASWRVQALESWSQGELRNPDCAEVHRIAGLLEYDRSRPEQALVRMRRATEFTPPHPDAFRRLGQLYHQRSQYPEALQSYSEAQRLAPNDVRIYQDLANTYNAQSNLTEASKALEKAVALAPTSARYHRLLADSYQDAGRFNEAETQLRTALSLDRSSDVLMQLGLVLLYQRREKDAIEWLSRATRLDSENSDAWRYLGLACQRTGRPADARRAFLRGLAIAEQETVRLPRSGQNHAILGYFCAQAGQAERARTEAAQAVQLFPGHNATLWITALTFEVLKDRSTALKMLEGAPRALLEDLARWPEASQLTSDERFSRLLSAPAVRH
jgi:serine/threonine protein kinase/tetratricopeptide (TPR) repeat protein